MKDYIHFFIITVGALYLSYKLYLFLNESKKKTENLRKQNEIINKLKEVTPESVFTLHSLLKDPGFDEVLNNDHVREDLIQIILKSREVSPTSLKTLFQSYQRRDKVSQLKGIRSSILDAFLYKGSNETNADSISAV